MLHPAQDDLTVQRRLAGPDEAISHGNQPTWRGAVAQYLVRRPVDRLTGERCNIHAHAMPSSRNAGRQISV